MGRCCRGQEKDREKLKRVIQSQMVIFSSAVTREKGKAGAGLLIERVPELLAR